MASFKEVYPQTKRYEGNNTPSRGFTLNPNDNGNYTGGKKDVGKLVGTIGGITAPEIMKALGKTHDTMTVEDVKNFPDDKMEKIYIDRYWKVIRGDEINVMILAAKIFDEEVNAGRQSIKEAQLIAGLPQTGTMNDATLNYINQNV